MQQRAKTRLFPLHLAPIDEFFRLDDREEYPMAFTSHLKFSGEIQRAAFQEALVEALSRHPLLRSLIKPAKAGKPCWVSAGDLLPKVYWGKVGDKIEFESNERIDLTQEVGLRVWVHVDDDRSEVLLQFHHACCDGTGAYRFIGDLLAEYGLRTAFDDADLPVVELCDSSLLKQRRGKMAGSAISGSNWSSTRRALEHGFAVFFRKIAPISVPSRTAGADSSPASFEALEYPGIVTKVFDKSKYKALRDAASSVGAMFNDLLLAEMFVAMRDWNRKCGNGARQRLRIMMPNDLRGKDEITMPAANMTAYTFITRSSDECDNQPALLRSLRDETLNIKRDQSGKRFVDAIMLGKNVPGLIKFLLGRKRCLASVILSNVGDPSRRFLARFPREGGRVRCGNVRLERISGVPPLRPLSRATVSIVTYGREFAINVRCDPKTFTLDDANEFLELFASRLARHVPEVKPVPEVPVAAEVSAS